MRIEITHVVPPAQGWPIAGYCSICRAHHIVLSPYALQPEDGMLFIVPDVCLDEQETRNHTLEMSQQKLRWPYSEQWNNRIVK